VPLLGVPGVYKLCFAYSPLNLQDLRAFSSQVSPYKIVGPDQVDKGCSLSMPCNIPVTGIDLGEDNAVLIIDRTSNCGDLNPKLTYYSGVTNPKRTDNPFNNATEDTFFTGTPITGLPGFSTSKVCWSHDP